MIDLGNTQDLHRLYSAIDASRQALRPFRQNRLKILREFVGSYYNTQGAQFEVLVNLLNITADAYTIGLAARTPRVRVTTPHVQLRSFGYRYQQALNHYIEEIHFRETLQQIVLDAFFTGGIAKVFLAEWQSIQLLDDVWADPGRPYCCRVSFDDFGLDMSVKDVRRCKFMWDEYRVPWSAVTSDGDYDQSVVKLLAPSSKWERGEEQAQQISSGALVDDDEYEPMCDLMDVWLPDLEQVAVMSRHVPGKPLKVVEAGPEGGPYKWLSFAEVPDNVIPTSPAQNLMGLHLLYNGLMRKQARQAKRQKTNPTYRPESVEDAERLKRVNDGDWVKVQDPQGINVIQMGGVDQANLAFSIGVLDLFDRQAGNLRAMAGLGPTAPTLGQEQMIYSAASRKEAKMQHRVHVFVAEVMEAIGHLLWADQTLTIPHTVELVPGSGATLSIDWTPDLREGDFWQYNFEVEPYSMVYEPPEQQAQKMERVIGQLVNLYPILAQSGGTLDVQELVRHYAEVLNMPELTHIVTFSQPPTMDRGGPAGEQHMPAQTTRNYVRRNVPTGGTPEHRSHVMQQVLLGGGQVTPQQMNSLSNA
ncbi:MAG: hypothetical protein MUF48_22490 [Pirellulaceae bacterium]|nr:hypothetical protein [Pirellulaceae bacterium]